MGLFTLIARLAFDGTQFEAGMKKADYLAQNTANSMARGFKEAVGHLFAGGAAVEGIKRMIAYGEEVHRAGERLGISAEAAQVYRRAAEENGMTIDDVGTAMSRLAVAQEAALAGGEKQIQAFTRLGITADDLKGKDLQGLFAQLGNRLEGTTVTGREVAATMELMGRGGSKMIPVLMELNKITGEMRERGLLMSDAEVQRLKEANDQLKVMGQRATVFIAGKLDESIGRWGRVLGRAAGEGRNWTWQDFADDPVYQKMDAINQDVADRKSKRLADKARKESIAADAEQKQIKETAEAHRAQMDEAVKLDEEADKINEKVRVRQLSADQRRLELLQKRAAIEVLLGGLADDDYASAAALRKELASTNEELDEMKDKLRDMAQLGPAGSLWTRFPGPPQIDAPPVDIQRGPVVAPGFLQTDFSPGLSMHHLAAIVAQGSGGNMQAVEVLKTIAKNTGEMANRPRSQF